MNGAFCTAAPALAAIGLTVIPVELRPKASGIGFDKVPLVRGFTKCRFPPRPDAVRAWIAKFPDAAIGIVTGELSNLTVVDVDDANQIEAASRVFGRSPLMVSTRRGYHLYYRWNGEGVRNLRPAGMEADLKGDGGFVVCPPSPDYGFVLGSWESLCDVQTIPAEARYLAQSRIDVEPSTKGGRNDAVFRFCLTRAPFCDDLKQVVDVALSFNDENQPPLSDVEVKRAAASAWRYEEDGRNFLGRPMGGPQAVLDMGVVDEALAASPNAADALCLFVKLKGAHGARVARGQTFGVVPEAMARDHVMGCWGPRRVRSALKLAVDLGLVDLVRKGRNHKRLDGTWGREPDQYTLVGRTALAAVDVTRTRPPTSSLPLGDGSGTGGHLTGEGRLLWRRH